MIQKFEIRISKSETNPKLKFPNVQNRIVSRFEFGSFEFVSSFEFRASDFVINKGVENGMSFS